MAKVRRMRIDVTAEDIAGGRRNDSVTCPVAHALARRLNGRRPVVQTLESKAGGVRYRHSEAIAEFIRAFDRGHPVRPFTAFVTVRG